MTVKAGTVFIMKSVLMVAEKPSLAQSLAEILSNKKCSSRKGDEIFHYLVKLYKVGYFNLNLIDLQCVLRDVS